MYPNPKQESICGKCGDVQCVCQSNWCSVTMMSFKETTVRRYSSLEEAVILQKPSQTSPQPPLFRAAAGVFSLTTKMWLLRLIPGPYETCAMWQKKHKNTQTPAFIVFPFHTQTHTQTHTRTPVIGTCEPRLVYAEHSSVTLAQHIKEPFHPQPNRPSCAPQHASAGPGEGVLFALSGLF